MDMVFSNPPFQLKAGKRHDFNYTCEGFHTPSPPSGNYLCYLTLFNLYSNRVPIRFGPDISLLVALLVFVAAWGAGTAVILGRRVKRAVPLK
jgi:hypothetical protein